MNIWVYSDESGVFDKVHNDYYVFAGVIYLDKDEKEIATRKYIHAESCIRNSGIAASSMTETPQPQFVELPGPVTSGAYNDSSDFIPSVIIKSNNATIEISNAASKELLSLIGVYG